MICNFICLQPCSAARSGSRMSSNESNNKSPPCHEENQHHHHQRGGRDPNPNNCSEVITLADLQHMHSNAPTSVGAGGGGGIGIVGCPHFHHSITKRSSSSQSTTSLMSNQGDICRICHCEADEESPLITPCLCLGSLQHVHQGCIQQWIKSSNTQHCELCRFPFVMQTKLKPIGKVSCGDKACFT